MYLFRVFRGVSFKWSYIGFAGDLKGFGGGFLLRVFLNRVSGGSVGLRVEGGFWVWGFGFRVPSLGSFTVPLRAPLRGAPLKGSVEWGFP